MKLLWNITFRQLCHSRSRLFLAIMSMVLTTCLIVFLVGSYESLIADYDDSVEGYMGSYDLIVSGNKSLLDAIKNDVHVERGDLISQSRVVIKPLKEGSKGLSIVLAGDVLPENDIAQRREIGLPARSPILVGIDSEFATYTLSSGRWFLADSTEIEAVLGSAAAEKMGVEIGDTLEVSSENGVFKVVIVGTIPQSFASPVIARFRNGPSTSSLMLSLENAQKIVGKAFKITHLHLKLRGAESDFIKHWENPEVQFVNKEAFREILRSDRSLRGKRKEGHSAMILTLLSTAFIIMTTLSMGVNERIRQLAILRALGLQRYQVALIVVFESILLALPAWIIGLFSGQLLLVSLALIKPQIYSLGNFISVDVLVYSGVSILVGALLASLIPAIKATMVKPLDAIKEQLTVKTFRKITLISIVGILFILVPLLLIFVPGIDLKLRQKLFGIFGYSCLVLGFIMLVPLLLKVMEKIFVKFFAKLLGFMPEFLQLQLSSNLLRSMGTIVSMGVGLALFCAIQIWGFSMVVPFLPSGEAMPQMVGVFMPMGLPENLVDKVKNIEEINKDKFLPAFLEQPKIFAEQKKSFELLAQDNVTLMGVDITKAFAGAEGMFRFSFLQGSLPEAIGKLKSGRYCLIVDGLQVHTNLNLGDKLQLAVPNSDKVVGYEVAGVVHIPGWHWMTKTSGLRRRGGFTAGLVITSEEFIKEDFNLSGPCAFWFDSVGAASTITIEKKLQTIAEELTNSTVDGKVIKRPFAKLTTVNGTEKSVNSKASRDIWAISYLPLIMLLLTSLAMMNTVAASVKSRSWEFGVMRSMGMARWQLFRLVIGETLLMSVIAFVGSFLFGILAAWCTINFYRYGYYFGGIIAEITVPYRNIAIGFGINLLLSLLAALYPAWRICNLSPLELFQSGKKFTE